MRGEFKFVLSRDGQLYIGFSCNDYHRDICGNLSEFHVKGAGYLYYDKVTQEWQCNGESAGYNIGFTPVVAHLIETFMKKFTPETLIEEFDGSARFNTKVA